MTNQRAIELITQIKNGDESAFTELYHGYYNLVFSICLKIVVDEGTAEDTASEVFVKVWKKLDRWDASKGRFVCWLSMVARNTAIDKVRQRKFKVVPRLFTERELDIDVDIEDRSASVLDGLIANELFEIINAALKKLENQRYAEYYKLYSFESNSYPDISAKTGAKIGTVRIGIHRAELKLREIILSDYPELEEML